MSTQQPEFPGIASLTLNDIVNWAGDTIVARGRSYQRGGNVVELSITRDGKLLGCAGHPPVFGCGLRER